MEDHFGEVGVGETYAIQGKADDVIYSLLGVKNPNYVMRMMATVGQLLEDDTCEETVRRWKENGEYVPNKFKYKLPFDWNFCYHYAVDNHSNLKYELPSIEDTRMKDWWEYPLIAFILDI